MTPEETLVQNQRVAGELARGLLAAGVKHVILSPGSRSTPLALAFHALAACTLHVVLDERAAAFVALGIGRASGVPAVALATSGSAGANYFPAVVEANAARVPMILLTCDRPGELHDCGAPQTMPQRALFGEHVRAAFALPEPDPALASRWLRNVATRAVSSAVGSPAGPVHLNVPFREPLYLPGAEPIADDDAAPAVVHRGRSSLSPSELAALVESLRNEPSGAIVCGPLAPATLDGEELAYAVAALAASLDWPILADATSALRFGAHDQTRVITTADTLLGEPRLAAKLRVARILRIGQQSTAKSVTRWVSEHADAVTLVCPDGAWLDGGGVAERLVVAEPSLLCRDLAASLARGERSDNPTTAAWQTCDRVARAELVRHASVGNWEGRVVHELLAGLPNGARLHVASSMPIRDLDAFGHATETRIAVTSNRGVNGIDGTVATALGVALASRAKTAALLGDLAFLHDLDGLEAAGALAPHGSPRLVLVVVNNGGGGIFGELPIAQHPTAFERLYLTPRPADLGRVAHGLGLTHQALSADALPGALAAAFERGGIHVLEVVVSRTDSSERRRLARADAARLASEVLGS